MSPKLIGAAIQLNLRTKFLWVLKYLLRQNYFIPGRGSQMQIGRDRTTSKKRVDIKNRQLMVKSSLTRFLCVCYSFFFLAQHPQRKWSLFSRITMIFATFPARSSGSIRNPSLHSCGLELGKHAKKLMLNVLAISDQPVL